LTDPHKPLPVLGYTDQPAGEVELVNSFKQDEERLLRRLDALYGAMSEKEPDGTYRARYDQRWLSIARTHFQEGFMALNRAIFQPQRIALPEDDEHP
jgi:hypothetical protein